MKTFLLTALASLLCGGIYAQQDPLYAQYFNNPLLINPAFAGSNNRLFAGLAYRTQWSGIEGGPRTFNFNSHMSLMDNKVGAGLIVVQDQLGEFKTTHYGGAFSYKIRLTDADFSFGMQVGFVQYSTDLKDVKIQNPDPLFVPYSETKFNTGVGVLLKNEHYSVGLSVPQLLANSVTMGNNSVKVYNQNYYLFGSYNFLLGERMEFRPSALLRLTKSAPISGDLNLNFTLDRLYTAGLLARNLNTYGVLLQFVIRNARVGYVFEMPGKGSALNFNTHEISLALSLAVLSSHEHLVSGF